MARALAKAGYVVISYDRLGCAKSSYFDHPRGGLTLTTAVQRGLLHQVVGEVKTGDYKTSGGNDCSAPQRPRPSPRRTRRTRVCSQLILPNTEHLFMAHRSLALWVDHVVHWRGSRGLNASP